MKLFDEDKISDEVVGSLLFNMKECINEKVIHSSHLLFRMANTSGRIYMEHPWDVQELIQLQ